MLINVEETIEKLSLPEKVKLLSGIDFWHTYAIPRLNIPSVRMSDGPNGIRGTRFFASVPAACFPCGTALGATWDGPLLTKAGATMAEEAVAKGATIILGPTVNIQRSPLGGRGFESFSEDPFLSGALAAAEINGIQSKKGVIATIKHFTVNDQEHDRQAVDTILSDRALREIYLMPFMVAVRNSNPGAFMTAYNKYNGVHCSENPKLLAGILRGEWNWSGLVMSDWYGTYSTSSAINAGLDLEMPGPIRFRGERLLHAVTSKKVKVSVLNERVRNVLNMINTVAEAGVPENAEEKGADTPETAALLRTIAADAIVLLKNTNSVLPLDKTKTVAVIGPNAKVATYCGGGSASLNPYYAITPFDGIVAKVGADNVKYSLGGQSHKYIPLMDTVIKRADGAPGLLFRAFKTYEDAASYDEDVVPLTTVELKKTDSFLGDFSHPSLPGTWYASLDGYFTPTEAGVYEFGVSVAGTARLYVDKTLVVDNATVQTKGEYAFNSGSIEEHGTIALEAGKKYHVKLVFGSLNTSQLSKDSVFVDRNGAVRFGMARVISAEEEIALAVELASKVDQVVLCIGLNSDWESEGYDRQFMDLPQHMDELVSKVAAVNPNVVVVNQSGTPVTMPWVDSVGGLLQAWYGGNETGNAIADVLFGDVVPSGKLPLSWPVRNEDNPAFLNYRSERGRVWYGEDVYVGYRFYEKTKKDVLFKFGYGLSYTKFELSGFEAKIEGDEVVVQVTVANVGAIAGKEVVQVYFSQHAPSINRPPKELKAFAKIAVAPGETEVVKLVVPVKYACSFWDEIENSWICEKDTYTVTVTNGVDSLSSDVVVGKTTFWNGV
ncbi:glycoside hydrolase superfamily [Lipomyces arxii]|uniref:glycoside hydrolase superfamily n=1 Tax=Lipomyces arxii TaxID=56418 RepID=UPI0034CFDE93